MDRGTNMGIGSHGKIPGKSPEEIKRIRQEQREQAEARIRQRKEDRLGKIEELTSFDEARSIGTVHSDLNQSSAMNREIAEAALKKAFALDSKKNNVPIDEWEPGVFEVPVQLAALYRRHQWRLKEAIKVYKWVIRHRGWRYEKVGLAAAFEDEGKSDEALELYGEVLDQHPTDPYALNGIGRVYSSLGKAEEATKAFAEAARHSEGQRDTRRSAAIGLKKLRKQYRKNDDAESVQWVNSLIEELGLD